MNKVAIHGGFDLKDQIKSLGGTFRASDKAWLMTQASFGKLMERNRPSWGMATFRAFGKISAYSELA